MKTRQAPGNSEKRFRITYEFVTARMKSGKILDIGEKNNFTKYWNDREWQEIMNTEGDLNFNWYPILDSGFQTVFCFQVIEHLLNPLYFMDRLHRFTLPGSSLFLSFPSRPKWMWNDEEHFHEYDKIRFDYLCKLSGWKVIDSKPIYLRYLKPGIRPLLRNFIPQTRIYELRKV